MVVDKLYRSILGREGGDDEKNIQLDRLRCGLAIHIIVNDLVGSDEYRQKAQLRAVPLPDMSVYSTLKSSCLISSISFADLYSNGIQSAEYLVLSEHCIKTF